MSEQLSPEQEKRRTREVFNATADFYDADALSFWGEVARCTVDRIGIRADERVLDVCCGSGSSALLAAQRGARVTGIDIAENLLALARAKAKDRDLRNVEFIHADMAAIEMPVESFDAVVIVFGIYFVPDMERQLHDLWQFVAPGGRIAVTNWGDRCLEPAQSAFYEAMAQFRPDLVPTELPWERIKTPEKITQLFTDAGLPSPDIETQTLVTPVDDPDGAWKVALGSGFRGDIDELSDFDRGQMREDLRRREIRELVSDVHFAVAAKPQAL